MSRSQRDPNDMTGKVCLVTGGTSGIGEVTAKALAVAGARVILVGRNLERGMAVADRIGRAANNDGVTFLAADLSSQAEVRRLADTIQSRNDRLDVLLNNAGSMYPTRRESAEGIELTWALNHLAYYLLTNLLRDLLIRSAPARVVSVASEAHRMASGIDFDDPQLTKGYGMMRAYAQSKLANILFSRELARRLEGSGVTSNALHPGFVRTSFFEEKGWSGRLMKLGARLFGVSPERGARTSIRLASDPALDGVTGGFYMYSKPATPSRAAQDDEAAARLWGLSAEMTGLDAST